jgi:hypothetical protein
MRRRQTRRILGVKLPKPLIPKPSLNGGSFVKQVGRASKQVGQTSQTVSKDLGRFGEQAERIGKLLD